MPVREQEPLRRQVLRQLWGGSYSNFGPDASATEWQIVPVVVKWQVQVRSEMPGPPRRRGEGGKRQGGAGKRTSHGGYREEAGGSRNTPAAPLRE